ncbi:MAG: type II toxin-antitoxin system RelE/ParE family toxin [Deltaproteobacteria bacterium]|nr:type II toxin-antitoxin system RelE/ParE family toxin [Deltaproteobacteria bacterium]
MIKTFADTETERFFATGKIRRFPPDVQKRAAMRLNQLDSATVLDDLRMPPSNHLESLRGDRTGRYSIRINDLWRLCFRFENGNAYGVEIIDYH